METIRKPTQPADRRGVIAVIRRSSSFLVVRRSQFESAPGKICFPGGGVESAESEHSALVREVEEELGICSARPKQRLWTSTTPSGVLLSWWETEIATDAVIRINPREVAAAYWWTESQMRACSDLLESNLAFLDAMVGQLMDS